jgi:hypothetical protein
MLHVGPCSDGATHAELTFPALRLEPLQRMTLLHFIVATRFGLAAQKTILPQRRGTKPGRGAQRFVVIGAYSLAITNGVQATQLYQGAKHVEG